jgi:hypothetical protein
MPKRISDWAGLFAETTLETQKAAYLHSLCGELEEIINKSGATKVQPDHPDIQKQVPAVKEYARLSASYANIVNKLNALRTKNVVDEDDELGEFI